MIEDTWSKWQLLQVGRNNIPSDTMMPHHPECGLERLYFDVDANRTIAFLSCSYHPASPAAADIEQQSVLARGRPSQPTPDRVTRQFVDEGNIKTTVRSGHPTLYERINAIVRGRRY